MDQPFSSGDGALSPARVARTEPLGSILFRRWLGTIVDFIVLAAIFFSMGLPALAGPNARKVAMFVNWIPMLALLAYYPVTEGIWGRSVGKLASGMIVVDRQGNPPGVLRALIRTVFRLVEVNPILFGGIPAGVVVAMTPDRQRVGDLVAGTYVVPLARLKEAQEKAQSVVF